MTWRLCKHDPPRPDICHLCWLAIHHPTYSRWDERLTGAQPPCPKIRLSRRGKLMVPLGTTLKKH